MPKFDWQIWKRKENAESLKLLKERLEKFESNFFSIKNEAESLLEDCHSYRYSVRGYPTDALNDLAISLLKESHRVRGLREKVSKMSLRSLRRAADAEFEMLKEYSAELDLLRARYKAAEEHREEQKSRALQQRHDDALWRFENKLISTRKLLDKAEPSFTFYGQLKLASEELAESLREVYYARVDTKRISDAEADAGITFAEVEEARVNMAKQPQMLEAIRSAFAAKVLGGNVRARISDPTAYQAMLQKMAQSLSLVRIDRNGSTDSMEDLRVTKELHIIPSVTLANATLQTRIEDALPLDDISESVLETLLVLYGGEAYSSLEEAKLGAMALEGAN